jgi:hypothetical protein
MAAAVSLQLVLVLNGMALVSVVIISRVNSEQRVTYAVAQAQVEQSLGTNPTLGWGINVIFTGFIREKFKMNN